MSNQLPLSKPAPAVRVLKRSERVRCVACGHKHVTTARLPWCAAASAAASPPQAQPSAATTGSK